MKVYVFTYHQAVDCEFLGVTNKVFANRDDALKAFKAWRDDEMKYVVRDHWTIGTDKEDYFEAYEEGYYNHNHSEGFVNEYDVEEPSGVPAEKPRKWCAAMPSSSTQRVWRVVRVPSVTATPTSIYNLWTEIWCAMISLTGGKPPTMFNPKKKEYGTCYG